MKAIDLLTAQHREVEGLFSQCKEAPRDEKLELLHALGNVLVLHMSIEEQHFYPAALDEVSEEQVRSALEEHLLVKRGLADLLSLDQIDEEFEAKLQVLQELVDHHVQEEEQQLFPAVQAGLSQAKLDELGTTLERMTAELEEEEELYDKVQDIEQLSQAAPLRPESPRA